LGLGLIAVRAKKVTDKMFMIAAKAVANCSPTQKDPNANLLPCLTDIREVSFQVAVAVAQEAINEGISAFTPEPGKLAEHIRSFMWQAEYIPYKKHE
jgi:malate dehydrogenase (oxaloacetate-decarboxylating)